MQTRQPTNPAERQSLIRSGNIRPAVFEVRPMHRRPAALSRIDAILARRAELAKH